MKKGGEYRVWGCTAFGSKRGNYCNFSGIRFVKVGGGGGEPETGSRGGPQSNPQSDETKFELEIHPGHSRTAAFP